MSAIMLFSWIRLVIFINNAIVPGWSQVEPAQAINAVYRQCNTDAPGQILSTVVEER